MTHIEYVATNGYKLNNCADYLTGLELAELVDQATRALNANSRSRGTVKLPWLVVNSCLRINDVAVCYLDGSLNNSTASLASALLTGGLSNELLHNLPGNLLDVHYELLIESRLDDIRKKSPSHSA